MLNLSATERAILHIVQKNLPDTLTPYADVAKACGTTEQEVLDLLQRLKDAKAIRRFGAMIRHQKTPWVHNAMVAWKVKDSLQDALGELAASLSNVSHVYVRPSSYAEWPYTLYTMIHGRSQAECQAVIDRLALEPGILDYTILTSIKELKKVSMTYF